MRTSFHHQPEAQHPKSSAIHKKTGRLPHLYPRKRTSDLLAPVSETPTTSTKVRESPCAAALSVLSPHLTASHYFSPNLKVECRWRCGTWEPTMARTINRLTALRVERCRRGKLHELPRYCLI